MHETSLLSNPGQFGPILLPTVSKNDDEEHCFKNNFALFNNLAISELNNLAMAI
jgi:hypothetical protein